MVNRQINPPPPPANLTPDSLRGRFIEFTGTETTTSLTFAADLALRHQQANEPVAWVAGQASTFFPPDFARLGISLADLPVVRCPDDTLTDFAFAIDHLLRSGGFSLVIADLPERRDFRLAHQSRLRGLARETSTTLLLLTRHTRPDSLVSLRAHTRRITAQAPAHPGHFTLQLRVTKDKQRRPDRRLKEVRRGPDGLC